MTNNSNSRSNSDSNSKGKKYCILGTKHYSKSFITYISFNPLNNSMKKNNTIITILYTKPQEDWEIAEEHKVPEWVF